MCSLIFVNEKRFTRKRQISNQKRERRRQGQKEGDLTPKEGDLATWMEVAFNDDDKMS